LVKDFNVGTLKSGIWTSQPFVWVPTDLEGIYGIQVVIKDFTTGETAKQTSLYTVSPLVTGSAPVAVKTANPLVALFSAPSCAAGSTMRASFQEQSNKTPATLTGWSSCHPPSTMTFEIAGMYPTTGVETVPLSSNPRFLELIERSRLRLAKEGGVSPEEVRRQLGLGS
jgi:hypothetical protein